jgi:hypothetical protein
VPSVSDIEDLFIFGKVVPEHLVRDTTTARSDYRVHRPVVDNVIEKVRQGARIVLIVGDVCDGKTMIIEDLSNLLSVNRPVYYLHHPYEDFLAEVSSILHRDPNAALVIENCFDLGDERRSSLARMFNGSNGVLLLTSRSIAVEAEAAEHGALADYDSFCEIRIPQLSKTEIEALVTLIDQIAGWRDFRATSRSEKIHFVERSCGGSLPGFLLRLLKSHYVRERYREEYNKGATLSKSEKMAIIAALYTAHIGHDAPIGFLSNALHFDVGAMLDKLGAQSGMMKLVRRRGGNVRTVPGIGATNILEHLISDVEIVDTVVSILDSLAEDSHHDDFERHMFGQLMRYSILRSVVSDKVQINRFFDNISKTEHFRRQALFWLQWHIAMTDLERFSDAEKYLQQGYREAENYERRTGKPYKRIQLDDRKAKFLMLRARHIERLPEELFRELKEACDIVGRLFRGGTASRHPFETLKIIAESYVAQSHRLFLEHSQLARKAIVTCRNYAESCLSGVPEGYQRSKARKALEAVRNLLPN